MLPHNVNMHNYNNTIYINPNFKGQLAASEYTSTLQSTSAIPKNAHINPLFLEANKHRNTIHMNPAFFRKFEEQQRNCIEENISQNEPHQATSNVLSNLSKKIVATETRKVICNSKNRLIREPLKKNDNLQCLKTSFPSQPLLLLNKRKLIRKVCNVTETFRNSEATSFNDDQKRITKYKLDNRLIRTKPILPPTPKIKRTSFVGRYALKRPLLSETSPTTLTKSMLINKRNKKLQVLNINGLLYKSTRNSLKLKDMTTVRILKSSKDNTSNEKASLNTNQGLTIFVRGNKYVMDANKFKLTRVLNCDTSSNRIRSNNSVKVSTCKRIDIGGYTYVSSNSSKNVLIRTTNHLSRAYVHNAKQKSLQVLTKRLVKSNIPCPIFQRIGKCAAFDRGKCYKVHNKLQVAICSKFLRGECINSNCLLSHNISLSKMPACKFFLQGVCVKNDCPYLHKKLSNTAELCTDFLRGFCQMADKCSKRHEFMCPEIERNNICRTTNCMYCNAKRRKESQLEIKAEKQKNNETTSMSAVSSTESTENQLYKRYFIDSSDISRQNTNGNNEYYLKEGTDSNGIEFCVDNNGKKFNTRPKLGTLPSYIPL